MKKRDRQLNQRLEELFSSETPPEAEPPAEVFASAPPSAAPGAAMLDAALLIEQLVLPVYVKDREHRWVAVNAAFCQSLQQPADVLLGHVDKEQADEAWQLDDRVLETGQVEEEQKTTPLSDGSLRIRHTRRVPLFDAAQQVTGVMGIMQETTTSRAAASNDDAFRHAAEDMLSPMVISQVSDDVIVFANAAFSDLAGLPLERIIGQPAVDFYAEPANHAQVSEIIRQKGEVHGYETDLLHGSGRTHRVSLDVRSTRFNDTVCIITNVTDITARQAAEADLLKFKLALDRSRAAIFITGPDGVLSYVNPAFEQIYGFTPEEALGQTPRILKSGLIPPEGYTAFWQTLLSGQAIVGEITNKAKDGRLIPIEASNNPILDEQGKIIGFLGLHLDITERKQAEAEREWLLNAEAKRALQLQTAATISNAISTVLNLDELLPFVVNLIRERFNLYYVGLFLTNPDGGQVDLRAGTGEAGRQMLEQRHHLHLDDSSMIGWSITHRRARIALDVGMDAVRFANPLLPDTRSEVALPLISRGEVLGAMTAQSQEPAAFSDQDVAVLQSMAEQIANALANVQLFEQSRQTRAQSEQRLLEVQFLQRVSQAASETLDAEHVYNVVLEALEKDLGFTHCALIVFNRQKNQALTVRATGTASGMQGLDRRMSDLKNDIIMDIAQHGQIEVVDGWDDRFDRVIYESQGHDKLVRAFVPLMLRGECVGLLEVGYQRAERTKITDAELRLLDSLADLIAVLVANAQLFEGVGRRVTEMSILNEIIQAFALSQRTDELFETIRAQVNRLFDTRNFFIITYEGGGEWTSAYHIEDGVRQPSAVYPVGSGFTSHILRTGESVLIHNLAESRDFHIQHNLVIVGADAKSWMGVPLLASGKPVGVMGIQNYEHEGVYDDHDLALFSTIAAQAAIALQNARLFEQTQQQAREAEAINTILQSVVTQRADLTQLLETAFTSIRSLLPVDAFIVAVYDDRTQQVTYPLMSDEGQRFPVTTGALSATTHLGQTILHGEPLLIHRTAEELEQLEAGPSTGVGNTGRASASLLYIPMKSEQKVLGALSVQSYQFNVYTLQHITQLTRIADQLTLALQNAQLFTQIQNTARQLMTLNQFGQAVTQQLDVAGVLETTYAFVQKLTSVDAFFIALYDAASQQISFPLLYDGGQRYYQGSVPLRSASHTGQVVITAQPILVLETAESLAAMTEVEGALGDVNRPSASLLYVPLQAGATVLGVLSVQSYRLNAYSEEDVQLLSTVGTQVGVAIQTARLFQQTQQVARREQALREITARVRSSTDPDAIVRTAVRELGQALGRSTFIRLGTAEQLRQSPKPPAPVPDNGQAAPYPAPVEGGR